LSTKRYINREQARTVRYVDVEVPNFFEDGSSGFVIVSSLEATYTIDLIEKSTEGGAHKMMELMKKCILDENHEPLFGPDDLIPFNILNAAQDTFMRLNGMRAADNKETIETNPLSEVPSGEPFTN
jgi:hypothetical protein